MPQSALSTSRRQRTSESEARAPFNSPFNSIADPFNEDSTLYATYGTGEGSVAGPSATPRGSPSPPAGRSPESNGLCSQVPSAMTNFTKKLTSWVSSRESTALPNASSMPVHHKRSKSDGVGATMNGTNTVRPCGVVPPLNIHERKSGDGVCKAFVPRGGVTKSPTLSTTPRNGGCGTSPRIGGSANNNNGVSTSTTPRSHPPARPRGLSSAPTVPLRRHTTPPPVITTVPRGSVMAYAAAASPLAPQRSSEPHEPFSNAQPAAPSKARLSASINADGSSRLSGGAEPTAAATGATATASTSLTGKSLPSVGNYTRATTRLSPNSSLHMNDRSGLSRSQSSSTPCWVTDTSTSTPESFEGEEQKLKETRPPFFSAAPAKGEYVPLIEWLLRRGEQRDIGLPSATVTVTSRNDTSPRLQHSTFLSEDYIMKLCAAATQVLSAEPGLLRLDVAVEDTLVVVGDIHGQFQDLYTSVLCQQYDRRRCNPSGLDRHFLFMGDYVDRGPHSLEVVLLLLALKVEYPSLVYLTRGNHEEEKTSRVYGFLTEATSSLGAVTGAAVWSAVNKVFLDLPLAAIVKTPHLRFFVTHGGLSPCLHSVNEIAAVNRNRYSAGDITADQDDMVTGLLWSDPTTDVPMYRRNPRGCGFMFGPTASYNFCVENNVDFICRAHQVAMEGYIWMHNDRVVTVFSAPNYCGVNGNKGAVLVVNGHTRRPVLKQYDSADRGVEAPGPRSVFPYSSLFL